MARRFEGYVLSYLRQRGEQPYEGICAVFDPRDAIGLDTILQEMNQRELIKVSTRSVSITDAGLRWLEEERSELR